MFAAVDEREIILFLRINIQSQLKEVELFLQQYFNRKSCCFCPRKIEKKRNNVNKGTKLISYS